MGMKKILWLALGGVLCSNVWAEDDITVVSLNDFHGQVLPNKNMVGAAKISTYLQKFRQKYPNTIVVLAGDNYQGTAISNLSYGQVDTDFFNYIGVKFSAIGNHEFDYGQKAFESWNKTSNFKFLAANIIESDSGKVFKYAQPYGEVTLQNGKKIAFIGLATLETPSTTVSYNINNLNFTDPVKAANQWVNYLNSDKNPQGKPDTIALLTHIPSRQESNGKIDYMPLPELKTNELDYVSKNVHGISAILSGHSHLLVDGTINGVTVVQGASQGKDLSVLHYDCHSQPKCIVTPEIINLAEATKDLQPDPVVDGIVNHYVEQNKAILDKVIATSAVELRNHPESGSLYNIELTYTLADVIKRTTNSDIGLLNTYGVRRSLPIGNVTYSMIYEAMPFDNTVTTVDIKGKDLLPLIKHSLPKDSVQKGVFAGVKIELKNGAIKKVWVGGKPLDLKKTYRLATVNFIAAGGDGFDFSHATNLNDSHVTIREVIHSDWQKNGIKIPADWQSITVVK